MRFIWPLLFILSPLPSIIIYLRDSLAYLNKDTWQAILDPSFFAIIFGLCGYTWLLLQFVNSARIKYFDRIYGMDRIIVFHSRMAFLAIAATIIHGQLHEMVFVREGLQLELGEISLYLFLLITLITLLFMTARPFGAIQAIKNLRVWLLRRLGIQYQHYLIIHNLMVIAMLLGLAHVILSASTRYSPPNLAIVIGWYVIAMLCWINHKFIRPWRNNRHPFKVAKVTRENDEIVKIEFDKPVDRAFDYHAGQFAYFRFLDHKIGWEEHPLTISSAPHNKRLSVVVHQLGDWSRNISNAEIGDRVAVDGPYGTFSLSNLPRTMHKQGKHIIMIAGGIGIAPFLSMLDDAAQQKEHPHAFHLLWAAKHERDFFAASELTDAVRNIPQFSYTPLIGDTIDLDNLWKIISDIERWDNAQFFICGPPQMLNVVKKSLRDRGVSSKSIHYDRFDV